MVPKEDVGFDSRHPLHANPLKSITSKGFLLLSPRRVACILGIFRSALLVFPLIFRSFGSLRPPLFSSLFLSSVSLQVSDSPESVTCGLDL